jgi:alpha-galactosidase
VFEFNGNVLNDRFIDNLSENCCVEVPVLASKTGLRPMRVGKLPPQCALLVNTSAQIETLAVYGNIEGDKEKIVHAIMYDPLSAAVCSMQEIRSMVNEMFEKNIDFLPQFKGQAAGKNAVWLKLLRRITYAR